MVKTKRIKKGFKVTRVRHSVQLLMLLTIIAVPFFTQNYFAWLPSSVVMGQLPPPSIFPISGDTWCFSLCGVFICHPVALLDSVFSSRRVYMPLLCAAILPIGITMLCGRVFCAWLCPMGFVLEFLMKIPDRWRGMIWKRAFRIRDFRYGALCILLALCFFCGMSLISVFDPPHAMGRELMYLFTHHRLSIGGSGLLAIVLLLDLFISRRGWCRYVCPSGGGLSLLGKGRMLRIGRTSEKCVQCGICAEVCPFGLNPGMLDNNTEEFDWALCDNCGICIDHCPAGALSFDIRPFGDRNHSKKDR